MAAVLAVAVELVLEAAPVEAARVEAAPVEVPLPPPVPVEVPVEVPVPVAVEVAAVDGLEVPLPVEVPVQVAVEVAVPAVQMGTWHIVWPVCMACDRRPSPSGTNISSRPISGIQLVSHSTDGLIQ